MSVTASEQIKDGDVVSIYWDHVPCIMRGTVLHAASGPGEIWVIMERNGKVSYVMFYARMTKEKEIDDGKGQGMS